MIFKDNYSSKTKKAFLMYEFTKWNYWIQRMMQCDMATLRVNNVTTIKFYGKIIRASIYGSQSDCIN